MQTRESGQELYWFVVSGVYTFRSSFYLQLIFERRYNAARLRWNTIERLRGELENQLIDELTEWSMWHYATGMMYPFIVKRIC